MYLRSKIHEKSTLFLIFLAAWFFFLLTLASFFFLFSFFSLKLNSFCRLSQNTYLPSHSFSPFLFFLSQGSSKSFPACRSYNYCSGIAQTPLYPLNIYLCSHPKLNFYVYIYMFISGGTTCLPVQAPIPWQKSKSKAPVCFAI